MLNTFMLMFMVRQNNTGGEGRLAEGACTREEEGEAGACVS